MRRWMRWWTLTRFGAPWVECSGMAFWHPEQRPFMVKALVGVTSDQVCVGQVL